MAANTFSRGSFPSEKPKAHNQFIFLAQFLLFLIDSEQIAVNTLDSFPSFVQLIPGLPFMVNVRLPGL